MTTASPSLEPTSGRGSGDLVYAGVKERILRHELASGTALREDEVAGWFAASRVPAREALRRLEQEGLVERIGRSYAVRSFSFDEIVLIYRQRTALEHLAAEYAAEAVLSRGAAAALPALSEVLARQRAAVEQSGDCACTASRADFSRLDRQFHIALAEVSGQRMLVQELSLVLDRVQLLRTAEIGSDSGIFAAYEDHSRIFAALARGDAPTAKAELDYHFKTTVRLHARRDERTDLQDFTPC